MHRLTVVIGATLAVLLVPLASPGARSQQDNSGDDKWPASVLITNDNGIEDPKIWALAKEFSRFAKTTIAAPTTDQSGTGSSISIFRKGSLRVEKRDAPEGISAYAVEGYPADCVLWALLTVLKDDPPDLVISGINGGPNLGVEWFGSGTIGAARTAAHGGLPAIAISGLNDDDADAVRAVNDWVIQLAQSDLTRSLEDGQYLTVSVPLLPIEQIRGVQFRPRDNGLPDIKLVEESNDGEAVTTWRLAGLEIPDPDPAGDIMAFAQNWIVVVPMSVRETDLPMLDRLHNREDAAPAWNP